MKSNQLVFPFLFLLLPWLKSTVHAASTLSCLDDAECKENFQTGSMCIDGFCTNPYYNEGCLKNHILDWHKVRVCNSDDPAEAEEMGYCRRSPLDYLEVRALAQDWDTALFSTWILQIILSEMLDVPVSVETSHEGTTSDFYDKKGTVDYMPANAEYGELAVASKAIDCRTLKSNQNPEKYEACAHVCMETWLADYAFTEIAGIETPLDLGAVGEQHWWVPRFTAERDPELVSYIGMSGEDKRLKLAATFKRPTTWKTYCDEVSVDNCVTNDGVASRPPKDQIENDSMFVQGLYTGYFRATEENDCDTFPETCTGHIVDYPSTWSSFVTQQTYHLDIPLTSSGTSPNGGYQASQLYQIWAAANATKSDVVMMWFNPEALYTRFLGTDAEFTRVVLPPPTQECIAARADPGGNLEARRGEKEGACDTSSQILNKIIAQGLWEVNHDEETSEALWSPAYDAIVNIQISSLQYGQIFSNWFDLGDDNSNIMMRQATCQWVVDNLELIQSFIPESFPRAVEMDDFVHDPLVTSALSIAGLAIALVVGMSLMVFKKRSSKVIYFAQIEFLSILLGGSLLVVLGGLVMALPVTDTSCVATVWLTNLGYGLQLVPLAQRTFAINKLGNSGKQMQRVRLRTKRVLRATIITIGLIGAFLATWTVLDPPAKSLDYTLAGRENEYGDVVVTVSDACASESVVWAIGSLSWQALIICPALVVSILLATRATSDMNDTKTMASTIVVHALFLILRSAVWVSMEKDNGSTLMATTSILVSLNMLAAATIYIAPKLVMKSENMASEILPDLFLATTIMIADVEGFTAWSSVREPIQVFKFLETLYENFDMVAERHQIFKVETTGEYYVGASGIPQARADHAVVMARFASDCMKKIDILSTKLEVTFGPDTGDLSLRVALHSGPVTGGFMKGNQSRFQLYGDTMTTAKVIHKAGESNRIHISEATADLLIKSGKTHWVERRETKIFTEEKGELQTFWLTKYHKSGRDDTHGRSIATSNPSEVGEDEFVGFDSERRWIEWNTDVLGSLLARVVAGRLEKPTGSGELGTLNLKIDSDMPLEEVQEIIELPQFDKDLARRQRDKGEKPNPKEVVDQLRDYVTQIASMYADNPFHNFAHASYVVMAVTKYMNRINAASEIDIGFDAERHRSSTIEAIHDHTYGIASDPLTQFACVFAALIHDVDHPGVPNDTLIKENGRLASVYKNRSVAEQRSFDLAWDLLMDSSFYEFRSYLCQTAAELRRFRQLLINSIMATDLGDKELKALRNGRWSKAFDESAPVEDSNSRQGVNRKATIVIEHLIQAADVAHTCQHWTIYRKWNQRLFEECYEAHINGRAEKDPSENWYQGEIGFFDFYIIPLSKKLRDCGVFGPTGDENLVYAQNNRAMWEKEGKTIVAEMLGRVKAKKIDAELKDGGLLADREEPLKD